MMIRSFQGSDAAVRPDASTGILKQQMFRMFGPSFCSFADM